MITDKRFLSFSSFHAIFAGISQLYEFLHIFVERKIICRISRVKEKCNKKKLCFSSRLFSSQSFQQAAIFAVVSTFYLNRIVASDFNVKILYTIGCCRTQKSLSWIRRYCIFSPFCFVHYHEMQSVVCHFLWMVWLATKAIWNSLWKIAHCI